MSSLNIRNISDETRNILAARAAREGKSLQAYLLELVTAAASRPTMAEWLERVERRREILHEGVSLELITEPDEDLA